MTWTRVPLLLVLLPSASIEPFPGPIQPDPGTGFSSSRRGTAVAFAASFREAGDRYDPAATPTVFLWDRPVGSLRQVTASGPSDQPSVDNGTFSFRVGTATERTRFSISLVAFRSTANLAGKNADGSAEIFVWDSRTNGFTQVTDATAGASSDPALAARFVALKDANGLYTGQVAVRWRVAFLSTSDLAGDNPAGIPQVFLYDSGAPEVDRLVQVSHSTAGPAHPPLVNDTGTRVVFLHDEDFGGGIIGRRVFVWDRARGLRLAIDPSPFLMTREPSLDATGRWIAWTGDNVDPFTGNLLGETVVIGDLRSGRVRSFTPTAGSHRRPALGSGTAPLVCLSTDPGNGGPPVAERPVELRRDGTIRATGLPGGAYGALRTARERRLLFLTSTEDLDGTNAAGREVLWTVRYRP
jgi:hypothetical protein